MHLSVVFRPLTVDLYKMWLLLKRVNFKNHVKSDIVINLKFTSHRFHYHWYKQQQQFCHFSYSLWLVVFVCECPDASQMRKLHLFCVSFCVVVRSFSVKSHDINVLPVLCRREEAAAASTHLTKSANMCREARHKHIHTETDLPKLTVLLSKIKFIIWFSSCVFSSSLFLFHFYYLFLVFTTCCFCTHLKNCGLLPLSVFFRPFFRL